MTYTYVSQKFKEYDFWLRESRVLPPDLPEIKGVKIKDIILLIEEGYRRGDIDRRKATILATLIKYTLGYQYRIVSDKHIVIIPRSRYLLNIFTAYPQLLAILGNRHSGKTITAWTIALQVLEKIDDITLWVYGDVDGLGEEIIRTRSELEDRIIVKNDYTLPPKDGKKRIIIYNELAPALLGKRAMSGENVELNLQALRSRHMNTWVIYNVIRAGSFEAVLRETADIKMIKWMSPELLQNAMQYFPHGIRDVIKNSVSLTENEGIVLAPVKGKGFMIFLHETNPPQWLLEAHKRAKKNSRLMMVKSERERYVLQRIGELYEKGLSTKAIKLILEKEGINLSERSIRMKRKKWEELTKSESL